MHVTTDQLKKKDKYVDPHRFSSLNLEFKYGYFLHRYIGLAWINWMRWRGGVVISQSPPHPIRKNTAFIEKMQSVPWMSPIPSD